MLKLIGEAKLKRVAALASHSKISICVDNPANIQQINQVAAQAGVNIDCVVEVDVGQER